MQKFLGPEDLAEAMKDVYHPTAATSPDSFANIKAPLEVVQQNLIQYCIKHGMVSSLACS